MADNEVVVAQPIADVTQVTRESDVASAKAALEAAQKAEQTKGVAEPAKAENSAETTRDPETGRFVPKAEPEVPKKFQKSDGTLDEQKVEKAKTALEEYLKMERDFHSTRTTKAEPAKAQVQQNVAPPPAFAMPGYEVPEALKQQFALQFNSDPLGTIADVARFATQQALESQRSEVETLKRELRLKALAEDPGFLEPEVAQEVRKVLQEKPHILNGPDPYAEAYEMARGRLGVKRPAQAQHERTPGATLPGGSSAANAPAKSVTSQTQEILNKANSLPAAEAAAYLRKYLAVAQQ